MTPLCGGFSSHNGVFSQQNIFYTITFWIMFKGPIYETESNRLDLSDYVRPHSSLNLDVRENEDSTKTLEIADFHSLQVFFFFLQQKN